MISIDGDNDNAQLLAQLYQMNPLEWEKKVPNDTFNCIAEKITKFYVASIDRKDLVLKWNIF